MNEMDLFVTNKILSFFVVVTFAWIREIITIVSWRAIFIWDTLRISCQVVPSLAGRTRWTTSICAYRTTRITSCWHKKYRIYFQTNILFSLEITLASHVCSLWVITEIASPLAAECQLVVEIRWIHCALQTVRWWTSAACTSLTAGLANTRLEIRNHKRISTVLVSDAVVVQCVHA